MITAVGQGRSPSTTPTVTVTLSLRRHQRAGEVRRRDGRRAGAGVVKVTGSVVLGRTGSRAAASDRSPPTPAGIKVTVSDLKAAGLTPAVTSLLVQSCRS